MEKLVIGGILLIIILALLGYTTFTEDEVCGWKGQGKSWQCLCYGLEKITTNSTTGDTVSTCSGFNLSCNELYFSLRAKLNPTSQTPVSCTQYKP